MKTTWASRPALAGLVLLALVLATVLALGAAPARASEGDMPGMPGTTQEEMQGIEQPAPETGGHEAEADPASETGGHGPEAETGAHTEMIAASANWFVVGGLVLVVAATTLAAAATKRHLARRMASGELAGAGALDV